MNWYHRTNPEWLAARRRYITASDVQKLLPTTPTGRPRTGVTEAMMKVWAQKQCDITEEDIVSTGRMARGHLLEPFAIDELNKSSYTTEVFRHWDDALIYSSDGIAFSPDALTEPQANWEGVSVEGAKLNVYAAAEIKCYDAAAHYEAGAFTDKRSLSERWQLATAFHAIPSLEMGLLAFFNPTARHPMFIHFYDRAQLANELDLIQQVGRNYYAAIPTFEAECVTCPPMVRERCITEEEIIEALLAEEMARNSGLNP